MITLSLSQTVIRNLIFANVGFALIYVLNNFLTYSLGWPGADMFFLSFGASSTSSLSGTDTFYGAIQFLFYVACLLGVIFWNKRNTLADDAKSLDGITSYLICASFWTVLLIGIVDMAISFMRVQDIHTTLFSDSFANTLNQPASRGVIVHIPIIILAFLLAFWKRNVSVIWLALMVVLAEFLIVIARFIFSYEQTFMGDLVRFWYAALFLLASAQTLVEEGHVRVDVLYAGLAEKTKAKINMLGSLFLGIPLCWVIMWRGLSGKSSLINSPMLNFETSMSGYGMYVKYLMAAFLLMFALTMLIQFSSYALSSFDRLSKDDDSVNDKKMETA
jgi:TRAP-type mannitol/chloroaromatic compound transport system permease small subunit